MEKTLVQEGIAEHLRFMVLEVIKQVENTHKVLDDPDPGQMESIGTRDDYIDNLKSVIENKCFSAIHHEEARGKRRVDLFRAVNTITSNLERIADFAVNIVAQIEYLKKPSFIKRYNYDKFFKEVLSALDLVYKAVIKLDMSLAFRICRAESTLDLLYKVQFDRIRNELRSGTETANLITSHLILRYLERMGDSLLNIGEAVIFAGVGEKFKIRQYEALKETLAVSGLEVPITDVEFHSIWGTRSGCRIGRVQGKSEEDKQPSNGVLFKEGSRKKLLQEKENIERWEALVPGLPPKVIAHQQENGQASLLLEFLGGCTMQDLIMTAESELLQNALFLVENTLNVVWDNTKAFAPVNNHFMKQIKERLDDVYRLHPYFEHDGKNINGLKIKSIPDMIDAIEGLEKQMEAPFSVFIHGDFNINNIVYDHVNQQIHYIDLHRSKQADLMQDVSVFMVSAFRLPIFDISLRSRLSAVSRIMMRFAKEYANENGDDTFCARLALGLGRSFITSTRFELNPKFAWDMYLRGVYLLERVLEHSGRPWSEFSLPEDIVIY